MMSVTFKPFLLSVFVLNDVTLSGITLSVVASYKLGPRLENFFVRKLRINKLQRLSLVSFSSLV